MSITRLTRRIVAPALVAWMAACGGGDSETPGASGAEGAVEGAVEGVAEAVRGGYAPKLEVPRTLPDDPAAELMAMAVRSASVPPEADVGIPAYPGARLLSSMGGGTMTTSEGTSQSLPALALLSTDDVATVAAFYTENLAGWGHEEIYGSHMFWDGPEGSNPFDVTGSFPVVGIVGLDESDTETRMWPGVRTRIDLRYVPPGR